MLVSICVVAYNEEIYLQGLLKDIIAQDYPHNKIEVVLVDSMSTDKTRFIMEEFRKHDYGFWNVQIIDNPKKKQAPGWNVAIDNYRGDVIIRIDAHASLPFDFVSKNVEVLKNGEHVCGGQRPNKIEGDSSWKETLLQAEQSMFGSGISFYRRGKKNAYVKSLFHGAYKREVFNKVGGFNEKLGRTEDNEVHYRIRQAGYKIFYSKDIISYQFARNSLKGMLKQKFSNGYWIALTLKACPKCISIFHLIPLCFFFSIIITSIVAVCGKPFLAIMMWSLYLLMTLFMTASSICSSKKSIYQITLPILFLLLHISYGIGSLVGLLKLPFWKYEK